jgi:hypothetical protein
MPHFMCQLTAVHSILPGTKRERTALKSSLSRLTCYKELKARFVHVHMYTSETIMLKARFCTAHICTRLKKLCLTLAYVCTKCVSDQPVNQSKVWDTPDPSGQLVIPDASQVVAHAGIVPVPPLLETFHVLLILALGIALGSVHERRLSLAGHVGACMCTSLRMPPASWRAYSSGVSTFMRHSFAHIWVVLTQQIWKLSVLLLWKYFCKNLWSSCLVAMQVL